MKSDLTLQDQKEDILWGGGNVLNMNWLECL